ncbi:MAG: hypothetical protein DI589_11315 [Shinella sp.]|nr:MAG: hypothetical protein DI589_11315 [Shinella sp.]
MTHLTNAQKGALKWLANRNGDGVFDKTNCLCAAGERAGVARSTWTALVNMGLLETYMKKRVRITDAGKVVDLRGVDESWSKERGEDAYA